MAAVRVEYVLLGCVLRRYHNVVDCRAWQSWGEAIQKRVGVQAVARLEAKCCSVTRVQTGEYDLIRGRNGKTRDSKRPLRGIGYVCCAHCPIRGKQAARKSMQLTIGSDSAKGTRFLAGFEEVERPIGTSSEKRQEV